MVRHSFHWVVMNRSFRSSLLFSTLAGLISGVLAVIVPLPVELSVKSGLFFGLALGTYFAVYEGCRSFIKLGFFVLVCASACPIAILSGYGFDLFLSGGALSLSGTNLRVPALLSAGFVGAYLILTSGMLAFGPKGKDLASLVRALVWSLSGSVLGFTGLGGETRTLWIVWPAGVGLALAAMLRTERALIAVDVPSNEPMADPPITERSWALQIAVGIFFVCAVGFLGRIVYYQVKFARMTKAQEMAEKKVRDDMPSVEGLPPIVPVKIEDVLVLAPISGFQIEVKNSSPNHLPMFQNLPFIEYYASYALPEDLNHRNTVQVVEASVREMPNSQWARYLAKLPNSGNYLTAQTTVTRVVVFGQNVLKDDSEIPDYGAGTECFRWPSRNLEVSVCFDHMAPVDEFVKAYLQKHPSDL